MTKLSDYDASIYTTFAEVTKYSADELESIIPILDTLYDDEQDCINPVNNKEVPDNVYDAMRLRLEKLRPDSTIFDDVTASERVITTTTVKHDPPMTSISKANGTIDEKNTILKKWLTDCCDELGCNIKTHSDENPLVVTAFKRDGVALGLYYVDGKLVKAALRPRDGVNGEDVTENAKYVDGIPSVLPIPVTCSIRGEVECKISVFNEIVEDIEKNGKNNKVKWNQIKPPANPRNYATGGLRQFDDPKITKLRRLSFNAYSVEGIEKPPYKTEIERAKWVNGTLGIPYVWLKPFHYSNLAKMEAESVNLDYEVDGTVLSFNNIEDQEQLGRHGDIATGNPKGKLAWKYEEQHADVRVQSVRWQTGRTGRVTPVLEFSGVQLAGTTVKNCTAHNFGLLTEKKIGVGSIVRIIKSGKIIPKIIEVLSTSDNAEIPDLCPSCGSKLVIEKGDTGTDLVCNSSKCPTQLVQTLVHYLTSFGVKGLAESVTGQLVEAGLVACPSDFYDLTVEDIEKLGIGERTAYLTVARIHMVSAPEKVKDNDALAKKIETAIKKKKTIPLAKLIACFGIPGAGKGTGRNLSDHFRDLEKIRAATVDEMEKVSDVGNKTAVLLREYFDKNKADLDALMTHVEAELPKSGKLVGKTFVFTGSPPGGKNKWIAAVEAIGGTVKGSVSKTTDYVVIGSDAGAKADKAQELKDKGFPVVLIRDIKVLEALLN